MEDGRSPPQADGGWISPWGSTKTRLCQRFLITSFVSDNQLIDDNELIKKYLAGDKFAFEALVERYQQRIYNFSLRIVKNPDDASELTQEIFILIFRKINTFRGESKFSTWLYSIACNVCRDFLRRKKFSLSLSESPFLEDTVSAQKNRTLTLKDPVDVIERKEIITKVKEGIAELPLEYRIVVVLHDIQGLSYNEIAETLKISMGTVKSRLSRGRLKLAKKLYCLREQLTS
jgi:RNA polymerase sigma-70 factor (ECF subfamily)